MRLQAGILALLIVTAQAEPVASPVRAAISLSPASNGLSLQEMIAGLDVGGIKSALEGLDRLDRAALDGKGLAELSEAYRFLGRPDSALKAANLLSSRDERSSAGEIQSILSLAKAGDYASAQSAAERGLKRFPGDKNLLALYHEVKGRGSSPVVAASIPTPHARPSSNAGIVFTQTKARAKTVVPELSSGAVPKETDRIIDLDSLLPAYTLQNYSSKEREDLRKMIDATAVATKKLHREQASVIVDLTGSGSLANLMVTFDMVFGATLRSYGIDFNAPHRSCINHQEALAPVIGRTLSDSGLVAETINIGGYPWPEHHAVVVYPKDSNIVRSGVVLDPWPNQSSSPSNFVFSYTDWKAHFLPVLLGGESRKEIKRVDP